LITVAAQQLHGLKTIPDNSKINQEVAFLESLLGKPYVTYVVFNE
jgi:hypothetical protein